MMLRDAATPVPGRPGEPARPVAGWFRLEPVHGGTAGHGGGAAPPLVLDRHVYVVGNRPGVHLMLPSPVVSRTHALLVLDDRDGPYVRDLGSRNGVLLNGVAVREAAVGDGDRLGFGPFEFTCRVAGPPAAASDDADPGPAELRVDGAAAVPFGDGRTVLVGTRPGCDVRLVGPGVAPAHAVVYRRRGRRFVRDLVPAGGLRVDGLLVREAELLGGEQLVVGSHLLWYVRTASRGAGASRPSAARWPGLAATGPAPTSSVLAGSVPPGPSAAAVPPVASAISGSAAAVVPSPDVDDGERTALGGLASRADPAAGGGSTPSDGWPWLLTVAAEPEVASEGDLLADAGPRAASPPDPLSADRGVARGGGLYRVPAGPEANSDDLAPSGGAVIDLWGSSRLRAADPHPSGAPHLSMSLSVPGGLPGTGLPPAGALGTTAAVPPPPGPPAAAADPAAAVATCPCCGTRFPLPSPPGAAGGGQPPAPSGLPVTSDLYDRPL
jgi:pSer/pThr/pTyr-binding forkhead associated (FHA) protein